MNGMKHIVAIVMAFGMAAGASATAAAAAAAQNTLESHRTTRGGVFLPSRLPVLVQIAAHTHDLRWDADRFHHQGQLRQSPAGRPGGRAIRAEPGAPVHVRVVRQMEF